MHFLQTLMVDLAPLRRAFSVAGLCQPNVRLGVELAEIGRPVWQACRRNSYSTGFSGRRLGEISVLSKRTRCKPRLIASTRSPWQKLAESLGRPRQRVPSSKREVTYTAAGKSLTHF